MPDPVMSQLIGQLGIGAPLVALLIWLLRAADSERREITTKFLTTLESTIKTSAESSSKLGSSLADLSKSVTERNMAATQEHQRMIDLMNNIAQEIRERSIEWSKMHRGKDGC